MSRLGAHVYAVSRTQDDLDSLVIECPNVKPIQLDLSVWDETKRVLAEKIPNSVHLLVNNAGVLDHQSHLEVTSDEFDRSVLRTQLFLPTKHQRLSMKPCANPDCHLC